MTAQRTLPMDVPGFARLLKHKNVDSEVWWDAAPLSYESFKQTLIVKYPDAFDCIESLLPDTFSGSRFGISGATTSPRSIAQEVLRNPRPSQEVINHLAADMSDDEAVRCVHDRVIVESARLLYPLWEASQGARGWLSAQVDRTERVSTEAIVTRGLHLAGLAPNVMVKVPGSEQGYQAIESLVAHGCSVNNTFCFTVSQAAACLKAIHNGRLRAQVLGVDTDRARYVISFMIGRLGNEAEFERQARQRRLCLTATDRRWAELAVYQAIQALMRRWQTPARLLLCSLKTDIDVRGREHCWHLQRTGADTTLYTLTPLIIEFIVRRHQQRHPVVPASDWVQLPSRVLNRLMAIPYFNQAYFEGDLAPFDFARHPAFVQAAHDAREGLERLSAFVKSCGSRSRAPSVRAQSPLSMGHWS
ncbi:transaldolase family protein [Pseudomonas sp. Pseu.R1]|uniref:transaldolase family protein n=1 Tax=Pseudomonas sp. Pseu.R1 TaxID=3379818 RepID=UPI003B95D858